MDAQATFNTERAGRHLNALCMHFGRRVTASCNAEEGWVQLPFGRCEMTANAQALTLLATATDADGLVLVTQVVSSHLERFAFSENPDLSWKPIPAAPSHA